MKCEYCSCNNKGNEKGQCLACGAPIKNREDFIEFTGLYNGQPVSRSWVMENLVNSTPDPNNIYGNWAIQNTVSWLEH
jgi:hypothetical protein